MIDLRERLPPVTRRHRPADWIAIFALAFVVRMAFVLVSDGGPAGNFGYDAGVYYSSAASFLHGSVPYRDFLLLHPPGLMLALTPFAVLGRLTTDHTGFVVANTAFIALASLNAGLVTAIARRLGWSRSAALLGGAFYAVWFGAIGAEVSARLEPLGSSLFLIGMWLLAGAGPTRRRPVALAGATMGLAVCVKIWWIVPALVVLGWLVARSELRPRAARFAAGLASAAAVVLGPFFAVAPSAMWRMTVADQLARNSSRSGGISRLDQLSSLHAAAPAVPRAAELVALGLIGVVVAGGLRMAWRVASGRVVVLVVVAQLAVLLAAPTYFGYYSGYLAPGASLLVAVAAEAGRRGAYRAMRARSAHMLVLGAAVLSVSALLVGSGRLITAFPGAQLARGTTHVRCLMADSPMALIELDALSRNLADRCPNWVDVSGRTYDVDASHSAEFRRNRNPRWQRDILRYLEAGDAAIVIRSATGLSAATLRTIRSWPVLMRAGRYTVYRTPSGVTRKLR